MRKLATRAFVFLIATWPWLALAQNPTPTQMTVGNACQNAAGQWYAASPANPCPVTATPGTATPVASMQTLTLTTAAQSLTVPATARYATLDVTVGSAVYRDDGTAPTASTGMTLPVGVWNYSGSLSAIQFILPTGVTGTVVTVSYYK